MTQTFSAYFDGRVIVPAGHVELPTGQELRISIEVVDAPRPRYADFLRFAADLPGAPPDLSTRHDTINREGGDS